MSMCAGDGSFGDALPRRTSYRLRAGTRAQHVREDGYYSVHVDLLNTGRLHHLGLRFAAQPAAAAPGDICDDPARAKLARVLALSYLPAPVAEEDGDALASGKAPAMRAHLKRLWGSSTTPSVSLLPHRRCHISSTT